MEMPKRDTTGNCEGECRNRHLEGDQERQKEIDKMKMSYSTPAERSPDWVHDRNDPPGSMGGRV